MIENHTMLKKGMILAMLKVVWITHLPMREVCEQYNLSKPTSGGWLETMKSELEDNSSIKLDIVCVSKAKNERYRSFKTGRVCYHFIEANENNYYNKFTKWFRNTLNETILRLAPDLIHIHGTEFALPLALKKDITENVQICVSVQGLISVISSRYYLGGISACKLKACERIPLKLQHSKALKRGKFEEEIISRYHNFLGRTGWDYAHIKSINPNARYIVSNEKVRPEFEEASAWDINEIEKHSIFCAGGARIPIKGFHNILRAAKLLCKQYPTLKLYVTGESPYNGHSIKSGLGYAHYLKRLVSRLGMSDRVCFLGNLTAGQMAEQFKRSNCYVMASAIENSPNTLLEAMHIGTPSVVSLAGGVDNFVSHRRNTLVYRFEEYEMLAQYIKKIFEDDDYALELSKNARQDIKSLSDNAAELADIYKLITEDTKELKE